METDTKNVDKRAADANLSEAELEHVSGGSGIVVMHCPVCNMSIRASDEARMKEHRERCGGRMLML